VSALLAGIGIIALRLKYSVLDYDIWWHLKVGDWIVDNLSLPLAPPEFLSPARTSAVVSATAKTKRRTKKVVRTEQFVVFTLTCLPCWLPPQRSNASYSLSSGGCARVFPGSVESACGTLFRPSCATS